MPKYKVGDVLKSEKFTLEIQGVIGKVYLAMDIHGDNDTDTYSEKEFEVYGYTLTQPARWVPEDNQEYCFLGDLGWEKEEVWTGYSVDQFRLSIGNVFRVGDHAGIEALKRRWVEGANV